MLRLPISTVYNIKGVGKIICGTVEQGNHRPGGDVIGTTPSERTNKKMSSIGNQHKKLLDSADLGSNSVGISRKDDKVISPGDIVYLEKEGLCKHVVQTFTATVVVQEEHPGILKPGYWCPLSICSLLPYYQKDCM
jgi:elongation factor 1-alpha